MAHVWPSSRHPSPSAACDGSFPRRGGSRGQIDCPEKDGNCRSLGTLEDQVDVSFARDLPPEFRRRPLPDNSISEGGSRNLEWCARGPTRADRSAVMIQTLIELRLEPLHLVSCADRMTVLPSAKHMQVRVGTFRVKRAALL